MKPFNKKIELNDFLEIDIKNINLILQKIPFSKEIKFAGFKNKKLLKETLNWNIFGNSKGISIYNKPNEKEYKLIIKDMFKKVNNLIQKKIYLFIFPTFNSFTINKMNGVGGYSPYKNTILLFIYKTKNWKKALKETFLHELAHALYYNSLSYNINQIFAIKDILVFEGLAEHFREDIIGGGKAKWSKALKKSQTMKVFLEIKKHLNSRNPNLYRKIFYGAGKYKLWSGYSIGYYLVEDYLKNMGKLNWKIILKTKPDKILKTWLK